MQRDVHDFLSVAVYDFLFQKFRMLVCKSGRHIIILAGCHARSLSVDQISASWFSNSYSYYYYKFKLFSSKPLDPLHIMHAKLHKKKVIERWIFDGFFFDDAELVIISVADFFLKTHDFLPQVEKRADQTPPPPPPPPPHDAAAAAPRRHHHHHHPHLLRRNHPEAPRSASPPSLHLLHPAQIDPIWTDPIGKKNTHTRKKSPPKNNESIDQRVEKGKLRSANRSSWAARGGGGGAESN